MNAAPAIRFEYAPDGSRQLSSTILLDKKASIVWSMMRSIPDILSQMRFIKQCTLKEGEEEEKTNTKNTKDTKTLELSILISRTIGLTIGANVRIEFDDNKKLLNMETTQCRWGSMTSSICVKEGEDGGTVVEYSSRFSDITLGRLAFPIIDAKILSFTQELVDMFKRSVVKAEWKTAFLDSYDEIVRGMLASPLFEDAFRIQEVRDHVHNMVDYTVRGGKVYRALLIRLTMQTVLKRELTQEELRVANVLGWGIEIFQAMALVADDIMDKSDTRRGMPCWYKKVGVGCAINDSLTLYSMAHQLLCDNLSGREFDGVSRIISKTSTYTCIGQAVDALSERVSSAEQLTEDRYAALVLYKTSYYTFFAPIACGIAVCGFDYASEREMMQEVDAVSRALGQLFQEKDDYLDCFGDPSVTGKAGTDIQDGKCTWLLVHAIQNLPEYEKGYIMDVIKNGSQSDEQVEKVKKLYEESGAHDAHAKRQAELVKECRESAAYIQGVVLAILPDMIGRSA